MHRLRTVTNVVEEQAAVPDDCLCVWGRDPRDDKWKRRVQDSDCPVHAEPRSEAEVIGRYVLDRAEMDGRGTAEELLAHEALDRRLRNFRMKERE